MGCVTVLASFWASVLANSEGNRPSLPPCDELKNLVSDDSHKTDAGFECGSLSLERGFPGASSAAFNSGGGFGSGFGGSRKGVVYDPICRKWMGDVPLPSILIPTNLSAIVILVPGGVTCHVSSKIIRLGSHPGSVTTVTPT